MKIAELFVNLGVKGKDSAGSALKGVKSGLGEVKSMGLETKAMIAAVVYGLERMMSQSAQMGTGLSNFAALTDISAQSLQKWQFAMRQTGGSAEELTGNLKAVQSNITNMLLGKGGIEGWAMVANKVGLDEKRARDTLYVMGQLQKFAQQVPADVGNNMLKSFGVSEGTIAAMRKNAFRPDVFAKAPTYSDNEIGTLNKVDVAWGNLGQKIQMAMGHLTSKHGMTLVKDVGKLADQILRLVDALVSLGEQTKVLEKFGKVIDFFGAAVESKPGTVMGERHLESKIFDFFKDAGNPSVDPLKGGSPAQNINVQQTLQFQHDGKDAKKTGDSVHKAVKDAYRQMQAQGQGS